MDWGAHAAIPAAWHGLLWIAGPREAAWGKAWQASPWDHMLGFAGSLT